MRILADNTITVSQATDIPSSIQSASLTHKTARGFAWVMIDTLGSKLVNFAGQVALARLLLPEHWGLVGLAYTVTTFADIIAYAGLREVLIQRHARFDRWANAAAWMSLALGLLGSAIMLAAAPFAAWFYDTKELPGLIAILAVATPLGSLGSVPEALLRGHMRFRSVSVFSMLRNVSMMLLTVLFAALGFGAYSFVLPRPIVALVHTTLLWYLARPAVQWNPQLRRWRFLFGDTGIVLASTLIVSLISYGGYVMLGRYHDEAAVGYYNFAYLLSLQTVMVFGLNVANVVFPALSSLQAERLRQLSAFLRAARMLAFLGIPVCLLQAAVADPFVRIFFGEKWIPSIRVLEILCLGMAYHVMWNTSRILLQAQGRFRTYLVLVSAYAAVFLILAWLSAKAGGIVSVAVATALFFGLVAPIDTYVAIRGSGGRWSDVAGIYLKPTILSVLAIGPVWWLARFVPPMPAREWIVLLGVALLSGLIFLALARSLAADIWTDIVGRVRGVKLGAK